ncbi:ribosome hibernation-promoting factor, HPF/YfiA family [Streptosporangium sp. 'caverna']|jgi:ribosomal subunit interface protein|uniref:ribosome hibernation-promoting factor, HPF/YfiA family n=1 Tax=Streptosporangium TaxID=2000 RepID=UPI000D7DEEDF|nr:ribosome-associated translation inhibitor RaiA [Streptosporangium sp. 'caverna']AWS40886.1 ribosome-associated translation inhibitor RaiA [Streptosporangium sp. 'caverna']WSA15785.1 ribosome-associated translation inhibitor RaiA [Streptosporangium subroseum]
MEIIVKGRHTGVSDRFRDHVNTKLARIERLDHKLIRVDVEVSKESNPRIVDQRERVELTIHSRGPAVRAEASADDRFAALDIALGKLEGRLRRLADRRKIHHGNHCPPSVAELTATALAESFEASAPLPRTAPQADQEVDHDLPEDKTIIPIQMDGDGPLMIREKFHEADPITIDQALLEMELVGHDFYLFRDKESGQPSVVYLRQGYSYGVLRLVEP